VHSSSRRSFLKKVSVSAFALTAQAVEGIKLLRVDGTVPLAETVVNCAPLAPNRFYSLPLGATRPKGWLLKQLRIQANGLTGHLDEFWPDVVQVVAGSVAMANPGSADHTSSMDFFHSRICRS
jgi:hypothetical protein